MFGISAVLTSVGAVSPGAVAALPFLALGGRKLRQVRAEMPAAIHVSHVQIAVPQSGPQIFGDAP